MSRIGEKVAYLKGLAEGLGVNAETEDVYKRQVL